MSNKKKINSDVICLRGGFSRKCIRMLVLVVVALILQIYLWGSFFSKPVFPINTIQVVGEVANVEKNTLQTAMAEYFDNGFFTVNVTALKKAVEQLEWVESVSVRRVWPDKIRVFVKEHRAVARWGEEGLIDNHGVIFSPPMNSYPNPLVQFNGPQFMRSELLNLFQELQAMLDPLQLHIVQMEMNNRHALEIVLHNGIKFLFGRQRSIAESGFLVNRFLLACKQGLENKLDNIALVDLRYTNGFSVQWKSDNISKNNKRATDLSESVG